MNPLSRISRLGQQVVPSTVPAHGMPRTCALGLISVFCFKCMESERASLRTQSLFIRIFLSLCMSTLSLCLLFFPRVTTPARGKCSYRTQSAVGVSEIIYDIWSRKVLVGPTDIWLSKEPHKGNSSMSCLCFTCSPMFYVFTLKNLTLKKHKDRPISAGCFLMKTTVSLNCNKRAQYKGRPYNPLLSIDASSLVPFGRDIVCRLGS